MFFSYLKNLSTVFFCLLLSSAVCIAQNADPKLTEVYSPIPKKVTAGAIPSDAVSLFDGKNLDQWVGKNGEKVQ
ncbi:MAG TPA: hypothetical protein VF691_11895 [Cytophagaceae bacterium]|jgi:hypothetical protein